MLHFPLDHPRGLVMRARPVRSDSTWVIIYAYPFPGSNDLDLEPTEKHRPREKIPDALYQVLKPHLRYFREYTQATTAAEKERKRKEAMRRRPVFPVPVTTTVGAP
jgi:hypothetical protein